MTKARASRSRWLLWSPCPAMRMLVGDIGGTKTNLALAHVDVAARTISIDAHRRYASATAPSLEHCVRAYFDETGQTAELAVLALAGPIVADRCATTNLAWIVDARALEHALGIQCVVLINDLEAVAWSVPALVSAQLVELQAGDGTPGNACVISAGTGLGEAGLYWDGAAHHPFASEGGHSDFAPVSDVELALLSFARRRHRRVSWERVVSGMGVELIHAFLLEHRGADMPAWLREHVEAGGDIAAAIADAAARDSCSICVETMELLFGLLGREAGNLALKHMALGGVYLTGGVVTRNLATLQRGPLLERLRDKGRMAGLIERMPVRVIVDEHAALLGAARRGYARAG